MAIRHPSRLQLLACRRYTVGGGWSIDRGLRARRILKPADFDRLTCTSWVARGASRSCRRGLKEHEIVGGTRRLRGFVSRTTASRQACRAYTPVHLLVPRTASRRPQ